MPLLRREPILDFAAQMSQLASREAKDLKKM